MHSRLFALGLAFAAIAGCGTPPDLPKPLPTNYQEQAKSEDIYRRWAIAVEHHPGVIATYLSENNNPRQFVVVVQDNQSGNAIMNQYHGNLDGLPLRVQVVTKQVPDDVPQDAVPTVKQPTTWWGQVLEFFAQLPARWRSEK
ncbi:MAG TPA: hypothetical protein V6D47_22465 [Oscillatoriaceae cyanobacterium]